MNKKILLLVFGLIVIFSVSAQNNLRQGYVVTMQGDTLHGKINVQSIDNKNIELVSGNKKTNFTVNDLRELVIENSLYYSTQIINGSLVQVIVKGKMNLYKAGDHFYVQKAGEALMLLENTSTVTSADGETKTVKSTKWKGILSYLSSDCIHEPLSILEKTNFYEKDLKEFVTGYNNCNNSEYQIKEKKKNWLTFHPGVTISVVNAKLMVNDPNDLSKYLSDSYRTVSPSAGIVLQFSSPRISERLFFEPEILYFRSVFAKTTSVIGSSIEMYDTKIKYSSLSVSLYFKYVIPVGLFSLSGKAGVSLDVMLSKSAVSKGDFIVGNTVNILPDFESFGMRSLNSGYCAGIGVSKDLGNYQVELNLGYNRVSDIAKGIEANINMDKIALSVNLIMK